jgi:uncharacterized membrane protein
MLTAMRCSNKDLGNRLREWNSSVNAGKFLDENRIHLIFKVCLLLKGAFALLEIFGSLLVFLVQRQFVVGFVATLTQSELAEDPRDLVANYLLHAARHLSVGTQHFAAIYLLSHGTVKLWLIVGLLRERLWYYPTALIVFGAFIGHQLYLSFQKIISEHTGDVDHPIQGWQLLCRPAARRVLMAHPSAKSDGCAPDCNSLHNQQEHAANAACQR